MWMFAVSALACPDLSTLLDEAEVDLTSVRTEAVEQHLKDAERALGCGRPIGRPELARLWLVEGVLNSVRGNQEQAQDAFSALARTDRSVWNDHFGEVVRLQYEAAALVPRGLARISLSPELGSNVVWLDGSTTPAQSTQITGLHVVQVADHTGAVKFGRVVFLAPEQTLRIETGIQPGPPLVYERARRIQVRKPGWLIAAVGTALVGGGFAAAANGQNSTLAGAQNRGELDAAFVRQVSFASGAGLMGIGATLSTAMFIGGQRNKPKD